MPLTSMNGARSQAKHENPGPKRQCVPIGQWEEGDFAVPLGRVLPGGSLKTRAYATPGTRRQQGCGGYAALLAGSPGARGSLPQEPHALKRRTHRSPGRSLPSPRGGVSSGGILPVRRFTRP
jgi:hypothetical protein